MAKLRCVRHDSRVMVIDIGTAENSIPLTVHRNGGKVNEVCDSAFLTIDGDTFKPLDVLENFDTSPLIENPRSNYVDEFLQGKYDDRIYS